MSILCTVTLKVNYLTMFGKLGYFDYIVSNVKRVKHDKRRVTLIAAIPEQHLESAQTYATSLEIHKEGKIKQEIQELKKRLDKLEKLCDED